jgi:hypothetical protein
VGFEPTVAKGDTRSPGAPDRPLQHLSAERVGFEPTAPFGAPLFESGTIDHSVTSPSHAIIPCGRLPTMCSAGSPSTTDCRSEPLSSGQPAAAKRPKNLRRDRVSQESLGDSPLIGVRMTETKVAECSLLGFLAM